MVLGPQLDLTERLARAVGEAVGLGGVDEDTLGAEQLGRRVQGLANPPGHRVAVVVQVHARGRGLGRDLVEQLPPLGR
ncbi:hypothetical protein LJN51_15475 [Cellulomonas sp. zg-B12]|nr:hypothetical protein [Cellulomonas xiejunii]